MELCASFLWVLETAIFFLPPPHPKSFFYIQGVMLGFFICSLLLFCLLDHSAYIANISLGLGDCYICSPPPTPQVFCFKYRESLSFSLSLSLSLLSSLLFPHPLSSSLLLSLVSSPMSSPLLSSPLFLSLLYYAMLLHCAVLCSTVLCCAVLRRVLFPCIFFISVWHNTRSFVIYYLKASPLPPAPFLVIS